MAPSVLAPASPNYPRSLGKRRGASDANAILMVMASDSRTVALEYLPRIRSMVRRMRVHLPPSIETEDLVQVGLLGLLAACQRWSPELGDHREAFLLTRARGAILDELRALDVLSRGERRDVRRMNVASIHLRSEVGRAPTSQELADRMGVPVERVAVLEGLAATRPQRSAAEPSCQPEAHERAERSELCTRLASLRLSLSDRARTVLSMYYDEDLSLKEIGRTLGVTESRACQIHGHAVRTLRAGFAAA